jgi:hypothetical protein
MTRWWLRAFAIAGFLAVSCGSGGHASTFRATPSPANTTSSPTSYPNASYPSASYPSPPYPAPATASSARTQQCPAVEPAPQFQPSAPSSRNLALVTLRGSQGFVVRDITDINHATTVGVVDAPSMPRFVSATDVSYVDQNGNLVRFAYGGSTRALVAACAGLFDWSRDGTTVAYMSPSDSVMMLHQLSAGRDRTLDTVPGLPSVFGCESQTCADAWDFRLSYSPDGAHISLGLSVAGVFGIWTVDGTRERIDLHTSETMTAWSGDSLYFRDNIGVERWRNGTQSLMLSGVAWIRPKASPGGGQIVYVARQLGEPDVFLLDTASGSARMVAKLRSEPTFLTSRYLWYQGERLCVSGDPYPCGDVSTILTGKSYIYDLQTGTEAESIITRVWDVWPHPA